MVKNLNTSLSVLYLKPSICKTCPKEKNCKDEDRKSHLFIMAITDDENENILYGGYVCSMNTEQNVPADKGSFLGEKYFIDEDLTKIFNLKEWEEL